MKYTERHRVEVEKFMPQPGEKKQAGGESGVVRRTEQERRSSAKRITESRTYVAGEEADCESSNSAYSL